MIDTMSAMKMIMPRSRCIEYARRRHPRRRRRRRISGVSAETDPQCIPESHCTVARDETGRDAARRDDAARYATACRRILWEGGEKGEDSHKGRRESDSRSEQERPRKKGDKGAKRLRADRNERGSGRGAIVFSPLGSRATAFRRRSCAGEWGTRVLNAVSKSECTWRHGVRAS